MYGLPSPHNSESSSTTVKKKTRTDVIAKLFIRVYSGIASNTRMMREEWERKREEKLRLTETD